MARLFGTNYKDHLCCPPERQVATSFHLHRVFIQNINESMLYWDVKLRHFSQNFSLQREKDVLTEKSDILLCWYIVPAWSFVTPKIPLRSWGQIPFLSYKEMNSTFFSECSVRTTVIGFPELCRSGAQMAGFTSEWYQNPLLKNSPNRLSLWLLSRYTAVPFWLNYHCVPQYIMEEIGQE